MERTTREDHHVSCFFCGGPAHASTGAQYSVSVVACRDCVIELWRWHISRTRTSGRKSRDKLNFYDFV